MQPTPKVSHEDVERITRRDFSADEYSEVIAILEEYGKESWHRERERVQLAALKLAKGEKTVLRRQIEVAKCDYRDVLSPAEYPEYSKNFKSFQLPADVKEQILARDWKQYENWINSR
jgi:hypothetical protein